MYLKWGTLPGTARCTRHCYAQPLTLGPEAHCQVRKWNARASAVPRGSGGDCRRRAAPLDAGQGAIDAGLERDPKNGCATTSWSPETTLTTMAHGGTRHRTTAEKKRVLADATGPNREGKGVDRNRLLTTKTLRWSERSKRARRRRISTARLDDGCTVKRRGRRNGCTPACTAWRGRRGGRGAAAGPGDWAMVACNSG